MHIVLTMLYLAGQATKQEADDVHWSPGETGQNIPYPVINIPFPAADALRQIRAARGERGGDGHDPRARRGGDHPRVSRGAEGRPPGK